MTVAEQIRQKGIEEGSQKGKKDIKIFPVENPIGYEDIVDRFESAIKEFVK